MARRWKGGYGAKSMAGVLWRAMRAIAPMRCTCPRGRKKHLNGCPVQIYRDLDNALHEVLPNGPYSAWLPRKLGKEGVWFQDENDEWKVKYIEEGAPRETDPSDWEKAKRAREARALKAHERSTEERQWKTTT